MGLPFSARLHHRTRRAGAIASRQSMLLAKLLPPHLASSLIADALFWVDDYKSIYADEKTFTRFLQSYSRGMGRGRLTREAKVRHEKPCRGLILSTFSAS